MSEAEKFTMVANDEQIGYCKPPSRSRFRKGASGNPRGRPKGSKNFASVLARALREKVVLTVNGKPKTVTKLELVVMQLVDRAAAGDMSALRQLTALVGGIEEGANDPMVSTKHITETDRKIMQGLLERLEAYSNAVKHEN